MRTIEAQIGLPLLKLVLGGLTPELLEDLALFSNRTRRGNSCLPLDFPTRRKWETSRGQTLCFFLKHLQAHLSDQLNRR